MKVIVFGRLRDCIHAESIQVKDVDTVRELRHELLQRFPELSNQVFAIAADQVIASDETILFEHSEVALLPPFSGG